MRVVLISEKQLWSDKTIIRSLRFKTVTQEQLKDWTWILFPWLNPPKYFLVMLLWRPKRSLWTFKRTIYQMDHIWGARSGLKKSLALLFLKKSAIILRQDFLKTLYNKPFKTWVLSSIAFLDSHPRLFKLHFSEFGFRGISK